MLETAAPAGAAEAPGSVARAIVGHDALDGDAEACVAGESGLEESDCAALLFGLYDLTEAGPILSNLPRYLMSMWMSSLGRLRW